MIETAKEYEELGLFPVPFNVEKDSCKSFGSWQANPQSVEGWRSEFSKANGIGIVCGKRSGNLQCIDVDQKHDAKLTLSKRFLEAVRYRLPETHDSFYIEETRSGGLHFLFKREEEVGPKQYPAKTYENNKEVALIELLGEGQLVFVTPSKGYRILQGSIDELHVISNEDFNILIEICKSFNEIPESVIDNKDQFIFDENESVDDKRAGSIFNRQCDVHKVAQFLCSHGWKVVKRDGEKYWFTRPGKEEGISATWNHDGRRQLIVFSSNTDFESQRNGAYVGHSAFAVFAKLACNDNFKMASAKLIEGGFVDKGDWLDFPSFERKEAEPFPLDNLFPEDCHQMVTFIKDISESMQVQPEMIAVTSLSVMSLAICGSVQLKIKDDWVEHAPIWSMVIAQASERKTPVMNVLKKPIDEYLEKFKIKYGQELRKLQKQEATYEATILDLDKKIKTKMAKGEDTTEEEDRAEQIEQFIEDMPERIQNPSLIWSDITPEAVLIQMKRNSDIIGIISSEADAVKIAMGKYSGDANFGIYLKGYSGESVDVARVQREEMAVKLPWLVLAIMLQPRYMQDISQNDEAMESGFVARMLFAYPKSKLGKRELDPKQIDSELKEWWSDTLSKALKMRKKGYPFTSEYGEVQIWEGKPKLLSLTEEAYSIFREYRQKNEEMLAPGEELDDISGWGGKLMGNIARIALSLHFLGGNTADEQINDKTMIAACNWIEPLIDHYLYSTGHTASGKAIDRQVYVFYKKIVASGDPEKITSKREMFALLRNKKYSTVESFTKIWSRMEELDMIRFHKSGKKGEKVSYHPEFW